MIPVSPPFRQIGIIGAGRVAAALARALAPHSACPLLVHGRSAQQCHALTDRIDGTCAARDRADLLPGCDVIALAVSDDALEHVVTELAADMTRAGAAPFVFHVSGRSGVTVLAPLANLGAPTAAIHPAMTYTGDADIEAQRMVGARFAVTSANAMARTLAEQIVQCLGGVMVEIAEQHRALYHAGLCHAANHLVALMTGSIRALTIAGVDEPAALLAPLVRAALENSLTQGIAALSGPLLRGNVRTIDGHLAALARDCPDLLPAYRAMALATLDELARSGGQLAPDMLALFNAAPPAPDRLPR